MLDNPRRQSQPLRNRDAARPSWHANHQPVRRPQVHFIKFHRCVYDPWRLRSVGLQPVMVRRRQHDAIFLAKLFQQRHRERRALFRRRARSHFVHQHQRHRRSLRQHRFQVQHVRRKRRKVRRDRLLVANIHQHAVKQRQHRPLRRHRNSRLRRKRRDTRRLQRHGFSAGVRPADHQQAFLASEGQRHRHNRAIFAPQLIFQNRMPSRVQPQLGGIRKLRHAHIDIPRESPPRKHTIEFRNRSRSSAQRPFDPSQTIRQFFQDAENLRRLVFRQLYQLVVRLDRFKRLHEDRLPGAARSVHNARHIPPLLRPHWNHKPVVAQRHVVFAALCLSRTQNLPQRLLDRIPRLLNARAYPPQRARSVVADLPVRQHASPDRRLQIPKIAKRRATRRQQREFVRVFTEMLLQPFGSLEQRSRVQKFRRLQHRARRFQPRHPGLRIRQRAKSQLAAQAQPLPRLTNQRKRAFQLRPVRAHFQRINHPLPRGTRRPQPQQLPQLVELKNVLRRPRHSSHALLFVSRFSIFYFPAINFFARYWAASAGLAALWTRFPFASPHTRSSVEGRGPCSTSRTRSRMGCQKSPPTTIGFPAITDLFSISHTTASSTSVPVPPLHTANPSANRISSNNLSSHVSIRTSVSTHAFALRLKNSAVTP